MRVLEAATRAAHEGRACALVTVVGVDGSAPRNSGARMLVYQDGSIVGTVGGGVFEHRCIAQAHEAIAEGTPRRYTVHLTRDLGMCCGGAMDAFIEPIAAQETLVVFGAGHTGAAVARQGRSLGFDVHVIDDRDEIIEVAALPPEVHVHATDPRRAVEALHLGPQTYALIVTHDHGLDQDLLGMLLPLDLAWLGMIGSRAKVAKFFLRLRAAGTDPSLFEKVSAPVGLDIGAETPEEIALSILAEVVRVRRMCQRDPQPLSAIPLDARGGDGVAVPPRWKRSPGR